jgi:hypothetical protein
LIALGGSDVVITDLAKGLEQLDYFQPGTVNKHADSPIVSVSWNYKGMKYIYHALIFYNQSPPHSCIIKPEWS